MRARGPGFPSGALHDVDASVIQEVIDQTGYWLSPPVLDPGMCAQLAGLYEDRAVPFRSTVVMARHGYGRGEYKYFDRPLPQPVDALRKALYARLAPVANAWSVRMGGPADWPGSVRGFGRIQVRHGVSEVRRGLRRTLGIIFHDAA
jgi:hypothetical protein